MFDKLAAILEDEGLVKTPKTAIGEMSPAQLRNPQFQRLLASGGKGIKQALALADHLGIPSQKLPWTSDIILNWAREERVNIYELGLRSGVLERSGLPAISSRGDSITGLSFSQYEKGLGRRVQNLKGGDEVLWDEAGWG